MRSPQESAASWDPPRQTARGPAFRRTLQSSAQSRDVLDGTVADRPRGELGHAALAIRSADPASLPPGAPRAPASNNLRSRQTEGDVEVERSLDNRNERLCQPLTPALSPKRRGKCHERGAGVRLAPLARPRSPNNQRAKAGRLVGAQGGRARTRRDPPVLGLT